MITVLIKRGNVKLEMHDEDKAEVRNVKDHQQQQEARRGMRRAPLRASLRKSLDCRPRPGS